MDAPIDRDIKSHRATSVLLADFKRQLPSFFRSDGSLKRLVNYFQIEALVKLIQPLQEWPQLLDPHLAEIVTPLIHDFVSSLDQVEEDNPGWDRVKNAFGGTYPGYRGITKILYNLCKIRGDKIISRFFSNEPKYLEPMLTAFERRNRTTLKDFNGVVRQTMLWEERYVMLLWISHLLFTPFDLRTISSDDIDTEESRGLLGEKYGVTVPDGLPDISIRILTICFAYVDNPSKEGAEATLALVRLSTRPDMIKAGLLKHLLKWAIDTCSEKSETKTLFGYVSVLSYLTGVLQNAGSALSDSDFRAIVRCSRFINEGTGDKQKIIKSSALPQKALIKLLRAITLHSLSTATDDPASVDADILEDVIDRFLTALGYSDAPVRLAASKALSIVAAKLPSELAGQVVDAVVGSLQEDVLWTREDNKKSVTRSFQSAGWKMDLSAVNPLRWHGLTMALAQLLFRRSCPADLLGVVINVLLLALQFEQRSSTGSATGVNVRDAACFGIWCIARRYKSAELLLVNKSQIRAAGAGAADQSVIQIIACQLVAAACLDPSGNIRRGSSAALQELIGRHPDMIVQGIPLVQVVDYHAVALRMKAITEVSIQAASLDKVYWYTIFNHILGWKGAGSNDIPSRRMIGTGISKLADVECGIPRAERLQSLQALIYDRLKKLRDRDVEERHGLFLALAGLVGSSSMAAELASGSQEGKSLLKAFWTVFNTVGNISDEALQSVSLRPELICEAACQYIKTLLIVSATVKSRDEEKFREFFVQSTNILSKALWRRDDIVVEITAETAEVFIRVLDSSHKSEAVHKWLTIVDESIGVRARCTGHIGALGNIFASLVDPSKPGTITPDQHAIIRGLANLADSTGAMEARVACVKAMGQGVLSSGVIAPEIFDTLAMALDDYTIDTRGDVGSWLRLEAISTIHLGHKKGVFTQTEEFGSRYLTELIPRMVRLAGERLDKVRFRAWNTLVKVWDTPDLVKGKSYFATSETIKDEYFLNLLQLSRVPGFERAVFQGIVSSSGLGSEAVAVAARQGLVQHVSRLDDQGKVNFFRTFIESIGEDLENERVVGTGILTLGFLFDIGLIQASDLEWKKIFVFIQKVHFKTKSLARIDGAIRCYGGMLHLPGTIKRDAASKLIGMLLHPNPKVRNQVVDVLYSNLDVEGTLSRKLLGTDWGGDPKGFKEKITSLKEAAVTL